MALFLAVLQFSIELLVVRNYALAVTFITPLALTIGSASGSQEPARRVIIERGADSLQAIGVALLVLMLVGRGTAVLFARAHARRVVVGMQPVLGALAAGEVNTPTAAEDRRHLYFDLLELEQGANQAMKDDPRAVADYRPMVADVAALGYAVLGACWHPEAGLAQAGAARASSALEAITRHPVSQHRTADELAEDVAVVRAELQRWS